jgi:opacity protein-like surface antigen
MRSCFLLQGVYRPLAVAALLATAASAHACGRPESPDTPCSPARTGEVAPRSIWANGVGHGFRAGVVQAGFSLGAGLGFKTSRYNRSHDLALGSLRLSRTLGGNWEVLGELFGGTQTSPTSRTVVGVTPVFRYNFVTGSPWVPFVDGGVGLTYTSIRDDDLSTPLEFNVQVGAGAHYFFHEDRAVTLQYRWLHLSNAYLERPNRGTNTHLIYTGLSWFF